MVNKTIITVITWVAAALLLTACVSQIRRPQTYSPSTSPKPSVTNTERKKARVIRPSVATRPIPPVNKQRKLLTLEDIGSFPMDQLLSYRWHKFGARHSSYVFRSGGSFQRHSGGNLREVGSWSIKDNRILIGMDQGESYLLRWDYPWLSGVSSSRSKKHAQQQITRFYATAATEISQIIDHHLGKAYSDFHSRLTRRQRQGQQSHGLDRNGAGIGYCDRKELDLADSLALFLGTSTDQLCNNRYQKPDNEIDSFKTPQLRLY